MKKKIQQLSKRERQIMDALYKLESASAQEVQSNIPDPPGYSSVRALLARMLEKDLIRTEKQGTKLIYSPKTKIESMRKSAIARLIDIFFSGSSANAVTGLIDARSDDMTDAELAMLSRHIKAARSRRSEPR